MWIEELKKANISVHVIATGAGAGLQQLLWQTPGSSAYLSGASFPYDQAETEEILGFTPNSFVSQETAIDLASAAYMKAFRFGGKKPVGIGITASVASEVAHRGDHRFNVCVITNDKILTTYKILDKGIGFVQRCQDGKVVDYNAFMLMFQALGYCGKENWDESGLDAYDLAKTRFLMRPFFAADGKRYSTIPDYKKFALMSGAFNPPHKGHFGLADTHSKHVVFEVGANPPHKSALTVQELLQRAKMLKGRDVLFSTDITLYLDKAKAYPGMTMLIGADALIRMADPKWGLDIPTMWKTFKELGTKFSVSGRMIDDKFVSGWEAVIIALGDSYKEYFDMFVAQDGRWDVSSTELRNKVK